MSKENHKITSDLKKKTKVVIIAGGNGTRMQKISRGKSKFLLEIKNELISTRIFKNLEKTWLRDILLVIGGNKDIKKAVYPDKFKITYIEEEYPSSFDSLISVFKNISENDWLLLILGDTWIRDKTFLNKLLAKFKQGINGIIPLSKTPVCSTTIILNQNLKPSLKGRRYYSTGVYLLSPQQIKEIKKQSKRGIENISEIISMVPTDKTKFFLTDQLEDIDSPDLYHKLLDESTNP